MGLMKPMGVMGVMRVMGLMRLMGLMGTMRPITVDDCHILPVLPVLYWSH